jgi:hypothetical protein
MPALRPIHMDPLAGAAESREDAYRLRQRERPRHVAPSRLVSNALGNSPTLAGYKGAGGGRIRGGTFAPGPTSGMF